MIFNKETARKTAEVLLQVNAIKLSPKKPFTWARITSYNVCYTKLLRHQYKPEPNFEMTKNFVNHKP